MAHWKPITDAVEGREGLLEMLDEYRADWNLSHEGNTPLIEMMRYKRPATVPWLLAHGADPNRRDPRGRTALHYAAISGVKNEYLAALLAAGARPEERDGEGKTSLDYAREKGRTRIVALLEAAA